MDTLDILEQELKGAYDFFRDFTNLKPDSQGYGLTADSTKKPHKASIASVGFALSIWVIAVERGYLYHDRALEITHKTLRTLLNQASHHNGFFAHFLEIENAKRAGKCEYSTIDTALCLNGVITAAAYFKDRELEQMAQQLLDRVDWGYLVFERNGKTLFRMSYNPDWDGDYVTGAPGFIHQWDMAAEQKMMYLQAAGQLNASLAKKLYLDFERPTGVFEGHKIIINPGGCLFAYLFSEAWLDAASYIDPEGVDWFTNTRLAALANRSFCLEHAGSFRTYHANSWGISAGDSPWGYDVSSSNPCLDKPVPKGTVSIWSALSCLPYNPGDVLEMVQYLYHEQPKTWGAYGFNDSYNLDVSPPWYSSTIYSIDKGCSAIMIENYLSGLIWKTYTNSVMIQKSLAVLGFRKRNGSQHE